MYFHFQKSNELDWSHLYWMEGTRRYKDITRRYRTLQDITGECNTNKMVTRSFHLWHSKYVRTAARVSRIGAGRSSWPRWITSVRTYVRTYVRTHVRTYVRMDGRTDVRTYVQVYVHTYVHTYHVPTEIRNVCTYVHMCVPMYICMYVHTNVLIYVCKCERA